jgi:uncharacterized protein
MSQLEDELIDAGKLALQLIEHIRSIDSSAVVAFSGGVDSAVVSAGAVRALGSRAVAWTSIGAAVPQSDREASVLVAREIGIEHVQIETDELRNAGYAANGPDRCFHCKSTLYASIAAWAKECSMRTILSGTNADDLGDYRPGLQAASQWGVRAPLAELGYGKSVVRAIALHWGIPIANKPASPCLASRIAYGQVVTLGRLNQIEAMERWLMGQGFQDVRARLHADQLLRLEIDPDEIFRAMEPQMRQRIVQKATSLGFRYVTMDIQGRSSGSMNRSLMTHSLGTNLVSGD